MLRIWEVMLRAIATIMSPIRWIHRLSGKQTAGLFLCFLLAIPSTPIRASSDLGPQAPTSSGGQVPAAANASIQGNSGTFTTAVAIDLPPGRSGMAPQLSIGYASGGGNGPVGVGWGIPMTSIIRTALRKGVPGRAVDFTNDEFYLNLSGSASKLVPVAVPGGAVEQCDVNYTISNSSLMYCVRRYHTEIEQWLKAEAYFGRMKKDGTAGACSGVNCTANPSDLKFWVVTSRTGMEMYLGVTSDSRIADPAPAYATVNYSWYLSQSKDTHGNVIDYLYTNGQASKGAIYYSKISYTGHNAGPGYKNAANDLPFHYDVNFKLEQIPRPDFSVSYRGGYPMVMGDRYAEIYVSPTNNAALALIDYRLEYAISKKTGRTLLRRVRHYGKSTVSTGVVSPGDEYPSATYTYRGEDAIPSERKLLGFEPDTALNAGYSGKGFPYNRADSAGQHDLGARLVDINADGLPDKIDYGIITGWNGPYDALYKNDGEKFTLAQNFFAGGRGDTRYHVGQDFTNLGRMKDNGVRYFDINGDGVADKIYHKDSYYSEVRLGTGENFSIRLATPIKATYGYPPDVELLPTNDPLDPGPPQTVGDPCSDPDNTFCDPGPNDLPPPRLISGPGVAGSPVVAYKNNFHFQWVGGLGSGRRTVNYKLKPVGGLEIPPNTALSNPTLGLVVYTDVPPGLYRFSINRGSSDQVNNVDFTVLNETRPVPTAHFTGLPKEGWATYLSFKWKCDENCGSSPVFSLSQGSDYNPGTTDLGIERTEYLGFGPAWIKVRVNGQDSIPVPWIYSTQMNPLAGIAGWAPESQTGFDHPIIDQGFRMGDINGDGLIDQVQSYDKNVPNQDQRTVQVYLNTPLGYVYSKPWSDSILAIPYAAFALQVNGPNGITTSTDHGWELSDVNGDGLADLVAAYTYDFGVGHVMLIYLNNGHAFNSSPGVKVELLSNQNPWSTQSNDPDCDYCGVEAGGVTFTPASGSTPAAVTLYQAPPLEQYRDGFTDDIYRVMHLGDRQIDVNGDGLPDWVRNIVTSTPANAIERQAIFINTGSGYVHTSMISSANIPGPFAILVGAKGAPIIDVSPLGYQCDDFTGSGMVSCQQYLDSAGTQTAYYRNREVVPDLMVKIDNGFGGTTEITYGPSSEYHKVLEHATEQPGVLMPMTFQVAKAIKTCDGRGQCYTTKYEYAGPFFDYKRQEVRGFRIVRVWEAHADPEQSPAYSDVYYRQDWPYVGLVDRSEAHKKNGALLSENINKYFHRQYATLSIYQKRYLVLKSLERVDTWDPDLPLPGQKASTTFEYRHSALSRFAYDEFGSLVMSHSFGVKDLTGTACELTGTNTDPFACFNEDGTPQPGVDSITTDDVATVTQYRYQGDEAGMNPGPWRVGLVRSSQSYQTPPTADSSGLFPEPAMPASGVLTATRVCYDASGLLACAMDGQIGAGDITHSSVWLDKPDVNAAGQTVNGSRWLTNRIIFNGYGQVTAVHDLAGNTPTTYTFDALNHSLLSKVTDALGNEQLYDYNEAGLLAAATDINGVRTEYHYDDLWRQDATYIPVMDPVNAVNRNYYCFGPSRSTGCPAPANLNFVLQQTLLDWNDSRYLDSRAYFDGMMRTYASVTPAPDPGRYQAGEGVWSLTTWNDQGLQERAYRPFAAPRSTAPPTAVPANQPSTLMTYDLLKRVIRTDYPDGTRSLVSYEGLRKMAVDGKTHWVIHRADGAGRLVEVSENNADNTGALYTTYRYDAIGRLTGVVDPMGKELITNIEYDSLGRRLRIEEPDSKETRQYFDDQGRLIKEVDARGAETFIQYDSLNRPLHKLFTAPTGVAPLNPVHYHYGTASDIGIYANGRVKSRDDANGLATESFVYDPLGRVLVGTRDVNVDGEHYILDVSREYDARGQVKALSYPNGYIQTNRYAANGVLVEVLGRLSPHAPDRSIATFDQFNDVGQLLNGTAIRGLVQRRFTYDFSTGRPKSQQELRQVQSGSPDLQSLAYFALSPCFDPENPSCPPDTLFYDEVGNITGISAQVMDTDGVVKDYSQGFVYDAMNRLTQAYNPNAYGTLDFDYYDNGNLKHKDGRTYTYDDNNRIHALVGRSGLQPSSPSESFSYDVAGNMTTAPGVMLVWDAQGRPGTIAQTKDGQTRTYGYTYDDGGARVLKRSSGATPSMKDYARLYLGNLFEIQIEPNGSGGRVVTATNHIFAGNQRISTVTRETSSAQFAAMTRDNHDRVQGSTYALLATYHQAPGGGGSPFTVAALQAHQFGHSFAGYYRLHEAALNFLFLLGFALTLSGVMAYLLGHIGRKVAVARPADAMRPAPVGDLPGLALWLLALLGRHWIRAFRGLGTSFVAKSAASTPVTAPRRRLTLLPWLPRPLASLASGLSLVGFLSQIVIASGVAIPTRAQMAALSVQKTEAGLPLGTFYYLTNHLGSATVILDDDAQIVETNVYKPFGELWDDGDTDKPHRFYFTGAEKEEFDLYQLGARWYSPDLGRFTSPDSMVPDPDDSQQFNRYTYSNNNPINLIDPSGHEPFSLAAAIIIGAVIGAASAAIQGASGGEILKAAVIGAALGAVTAGAGAAGNPSSALQAAGQSTAVSAVYAATSAALTDGNPGQAAALAAVSGMAGGAIGVGTKDWSQLGKFAASTAGGIVISGLSAAVSGERVGAAIGVAFASGLLNAAADNVEVRADEEGTRSGSDDSPQCTAATCSKKTPISADPNGRIVLNSDGTLKDTDLAVLGAHFLNRQNSVAGTGIESIHSVREVELALQDKPGTRTVLRGQFKEGSSHKASASIDLEDVLYIFHVHPNSAAQWPSLTDMTSGKGIADHYLFTKEGIWLIPKGQAAASAGGNAKNVIAIRLAGPGWNRPGLADQFATRFDYNTKTSIYRSR